MSVVVGVPLLECICVLACGRYICRRCMKAGYHDSEEWSLASAESFEPVPRMCRIILAVYEDDLNHPKWPPQGGYRMDTKCLVKKVGTDGKGMCPPYLIYVDHDAKDIVLAVRGLNLVREKDYSVLLNNDLGMEPYEGGYVHHGLLIVATWLLNEEKDTLRKLIMENPSYTLSFAGHSLGSGVVALLSVLVAKDPSVLGNIPREKIRCYSIAPARCMSLNLAILYADIISSVILQDDFLPRTVTPLEDIFKSIFCLPCLLCSRCTKDTFQVNNLVIHDPRRLYTPGHVYHIVDKKFCSCGRVPPIVKSAVPVEGRFEHVVLSCDAIQDHSLVRIEKEASRALELMKEHATEAPQAQKMARMESNIKEEHKAALEKAQSLNIPNAFSYVARNGEKPYSNNRDDSDPLKAKVGETSSCPGSVEHVKQDVKIVDKDDIKEEGMEEETNENMKAAVQKA